MDERDRVIGILADKVRGLAEEREVIFTLLEETQVILEVVSSEIPIHNELRQQTERALRSIRGAVALYRASLQPPPPNTPPEKT